jgi:hypothetical protein
MGKRVWLAVSVALLTVSCSSKKTASEGTFRQVLSDVRPQESCLVVRRVNMSDIERTNVHGGVYDGYPILQPFVQRGYLEPIETSGNNYVLGVTAAHESVAHRFDGGMGYMIGFCAGKLEIDHITYTEPSDFAGTKVSNVTVAWHLTDLPTDFTELNATPGFDGTIVSTAKLSGENQYQLHLTNEGWQQ